MGVHGLSSYVLDHSGKYLENYELRDTTLVIDGYNAMAYLFSTAMGWTCIFGGDYDAYYECVRNFFSALRKCNVEAIVILDGAHEEKKQKRIHDRAEQRLLMLKDFQNKRASHVFLPLMLHMAFVDALDDLGVRHIQCWFEADAEIAALAYFLDCPVLSNDSDFYVYGSLYIPLCTLRMKPTPSCAENSRFCMKCMIYDISTFVDEFQGQSDMLSLLAVLMGNDYVNSEIFTKFMNHVSIPGGAQKGFTRRKMEGLLSWLRNESVESAKSSILSHLRKKDHSKALWALNSAIDQYKLSTPTVLGVLRLGNGGGGDVCESDYLKINNNLSKLPNVFVELYRKSRITGFVIDIVHLGQYYLPSHIEDVTRESAHCISEGVIKAIHAVMSTLVGSSGKLHVHWNQRGRLLKRQLKMRDSFPGFDLEHLISAPIEVRVKFMYVVLDFTEVDASVMESFGNNWKLYIMCLGYWLKYSRVDLSESHFHSMLLMPVANYVQSRVGYFDCYSKFMRCKAATLYKLSKEPVVVGETDSSFPDALESITEVECLKFTEKFLKLRLPEVDVTDKGYFMSTVHQFAMFQSLLMHLSELNVMLNYPCPQFRVKDFYSGTFLYNVYYLLNGKKNVTDFIKGLLRELPNVLRAYEFLVNELTGYIPERNVKENRTRPATPRKSRRRRGKSQKT